jgi:hypothetical protein
MVKEALSGTALTSPVAKSMPYEKANLTFLLGKR